MSGAKHSSARKTHYAAQYGRTAANVRRRIERHLATHPGDDVARHALARGRPASK